MPFDTPKAKQDATRRPIWVAVLPSAVRPLLLQGALEEGQQGVKAGSVVTNGAGLCYLVRCVGTHQVPLDRISYLEAAFQHPVINLTVPQPDSPDSAGICPPMIKYRQNTPLGLILSLEGQQFWGVKRT